MDFAGTPTYPTHRRFWPLILLCALLAVANIALWFPGIMTHDSFRQYSEAVSGHYTAWHPPIMARLWSFLLPVSRGGSALLILHILLYWLAFYLIAAKLYDAGHRKSYLAAVCVALAPPFIVLTGFIWKDVGMAVTMLAAFALALHRDERPGGGIGIKIAMVLLLAYATLVRSNAIFGVAPLVLYAWRPKWISRPFLLLLASAAMIVVAIPASSVINKVVLNAEGRAAFKSLVVYDMVGIAHYSGDASNFAVPVNIALVDYCYTPKWWDPINLGPCEKPLLLDTRGMKFWVSAIVKHPVAYLEHRISHFNEAMFAFVGTETYRYEDTYFTRRYHAMPQAPLMLKGTELHARFQSFPLFSPALFVLIAVQILGLVFAARRVATPLAGASFYLALSSVLYALSFLLVGVANMYRYQFYTVAAAAVALVLFLADRSVRGGKPNRTEWACIMVTLLFLIAITVSRFVISGGM